MEKLCNDIRGAQKLLWTLFVLTFVLSVVLTINPISSVIEPGPGDGYATIYVSPASNSFISPPATIGDKFTVEVRIKNYSQVASWQVKFAYDKSFLNVSSTRDADYAPDHVFPAGTYGPMPTSVEDLNATHQYVMKTAATYGAVEYNGAVANNTWDMGLLRINFTIMSVPPKGSTYACVLWLEPEATYTCDENVEENDEERIDGYYEITSTVANHLELSPSEIILPEIEGDKIVGTDKAKFSMDMLIMNISASDDIILVEFAVSYSKTLLDVNGVLEGAFMNDTTWAPYGTQLGWAEDPGLVSGFILINPNSTEPNAGEWNWPERPQGEGVLLTIEFEAIYQAPNVWTDSCPVNIEAVFGEFFINSSVEYVPYGPPRNSTFTISGYNWRSPVAAFTYSPELVEVNKTVTFDASASVGYRNVDGALVQDPTYIKEYKWDWGDDTTNTTSTAVINHTYSDFGSYTVNLIVTDYDELTNSTVKSFLAVEVVSHTVTYAAQSFTVVTVSTGKIEKDSIVLIQKHRCLYFNITGKNGTLGFINITIPTALLSAASEDWMVILQGKIITTASGLIVTEVPPDKTRLSITFTFSSEEPILIFGTQVIPEFPGNTIALAFMAISIVATASLALSKKRKK